MTVKTSDRLRSSRAALQFVWIPKQCRGPLRRSSQRRATAVFLSSSVLCIFTAQQSAVANRLRMFSVNFPFSSGSRGGLGGHGPPKFLPHNYSLVIHGIITPVMLLTTVCVASYCTNLRLHAYSASEGTSVARTMLV